MKRLKKLSGLLVAAMIYVTSSGFTMEEFDIANFGNYEREFKSEGMNLGVLSSTKTYEDYRLLNMPASAQYQYIHNHCTVDDETGLLVDEDGFVGVAMGHYFGEIGSRYYVVLDTGNVIPVVKVDAKAAIHVPNGISATPESSVIEFVLHTEKAQEYFGQGPTGLASFGNFNNNEYLEGKIISIEKVSDERLEEGVVYEDANFIHYEAMEEADDFVVVKGSY